ncbi:MAG: RuvX/YqgF family protein, partial [Malacoplasma sp.]|nr:RuvX/YqgF family protein [Malacoplasma sp.]
MTKFKSKKIISIDYGVKRVGLAIADSTLSFALPLVVLENNKFLFLNIKKIIDEENINLIILGYPKTLNNYVSERHELIINFKNELELFLKNSIEIILFDESY